VIVSGPFGNPVANLQDTDAVLAIGTGTGVVPMLSLFERRANHLCNISKYALKHKFVLVVDQEKQ
jgi:NAD(P)H-flavin reductase